MKVVAVMTVVLAVSLLAVGATEAEPKCRLGVQLASSTAQVYSVDKGSPAESAGIASGDIIMAVSGIFTMSAEQVVTEIGRYACGDRVEVTVVRITNPTAPRTVQVTLTEPVGDNRDHVALAASEDHGDAAYSEATAGHEAPLAIGEPDNPQQQSFIQPMSDDLAREARAAAATLEKDTDYGFLRGTYLGKKNFAGEAGKKFWSEVFLGTSVGRAAVRFYIVTPFSEARYMFFHANRQFENLDEADVIRQLRSMQYAYIVASADEGLEEFANDIVGQRSRITGSGVTKVVIRKDDQVIEASHYDENGWAFPLSIFDEKGRFEIIAVSDENLHAAIGPHPKNWKKVR